MKKDVYAIGYYLAHLYVGQLILLFILGALIYQTEYNQVTNIAGGLVMLFSLIEAIQMYIFQKEVSQ